MAKHSQPLSVDEAPSFSRGEAVVAWLGHAAKGTRADAENRGACQFLRGVLSVRRRPWKGQSEEFWICVVPRAVQSETFSFNRYANGVRVSGSEPLYSRTPLA